MLSRESTPNSPLPNPEFIKTNITSLFHSLTPIGLTVRPTDHEWHPLADRLNLTPHGLVREFNLFSQNQERLTQVAFGQALNPRHLIDSAIFLTDLEEKASAVSGFLNIEQTPAFEMQLNNVKELRVRIDQQLNDEQRILMQEKRALRLNRQIVLHNMNSQGRGSELPIIAVNDLGLHSWEQMASDSEQGIHPWNVPSHHKFRERVLSATNTLVDVKNRSRIAQDLESKFAGKEVTLIDKLKGAGARLGAFLSSAGRRLTTQLDSL